MSKALTTYNRAAVDAFNFEGAAVRIITRDDNAPWFVLADVCQVLEVANPRNVAARLDDDEKGTVRVMDGTSGNPNMTVINEPGLYRVIFMSRKDNAKAFQKWVFHEVLPEIRKTGGYLDTTNLNPEQLRAFGAMALAAAEASELAKVERRKRQELEPAAEAFRALNESSARSMDFIDTAKVLKTTRESFFAVASNRHWIYKGKDKRWRAYESAVRKGYMEVIEDKDGNARYDLAPLVTVKGRKSLARYMSMIRIKQDAE